MGTKTATKITVITKKEIVSIVMRPTATVITITIAVAKKTTSAVVTSTARLGKLHLLSEIVW